MSEPRDPSIALNVQLGQAVAARHIAEARLIGQFGGPGECLHLIALITERVRDRMKADVERGGANP